MKLKAQLYLAIIFILFLLVFYPALHILVNKWATSDEYTHAFLVFPIIVYMVWKKRLLLSETSARYSVIGFLLLVPSLFFYYLALLTEVHTVILLSMYFSVVSIIIYLTGFSSLNILATPLILLLTLIPVPEQLYTLLTFPLQLRMSEMSEFVLRTIHVPMLREGNVMQVPGMSFEVIEACSGLRSVVALLTLSILIGSFAVSTILSKIVLVVASIPIAVFANLIRVVTMIICYYYFSLDLTEGAWHTITGLMVFLIAIIILILLQKVLSFWEQKKIQLF